MTVARIRYSETIGVGELVFVCGIARIGRVTRVVMDDPRFNADVLEVRIPPTSQECGCTIEALRRALTPLPADAESWGLRFLPGNWRA